MELVSGLVVAERFRLIRQLGKGGMGSVWLAQHMGLDVPCALKFIHEEAAESPDLRARFEREAKAAAQLRSPNVVTILDHGVWQRVPYIAMEYLEGEDLGQRLQRLRTLPPAEVVGITFQIARALTKAHAAGLVHRDLKPGNIFLVRDDDREIAKVLDFGVAKLKELELDESTKTGAILGTPYYMSPEQGRGSRDIDHRSDLWALAVVVYLSLVGTLPFRASALGELLVKIIMDPLPVPSTIAAVPPGFDAWWMRAVARDPAHRFQTAKEFAEALGVALGVTGRSGEVDSARGGLLSISSSGVHHAPSSPGGKVIAAHTPLPATPTSPSAGSAMPAGLTPVGPMGPATGSSWSGVVPAPLQQSIVEPPRRRGGFFAVATIGAVLLAGGGAFVAWRSGAMATSVLPPPMVSSAPVAAAPPASANANANPNASASANPSAAASSEPATSPEAPEDAATTATPATHAAAPATAPRRFAPAKPAATPSASVKAKPNCEPNFYLDAEGQKHFKPECFK